MRVSDLSEELGHVRGAVDPLPGQRLVIPVGIRRQQFILIEVGEPAEHGAEHGVRQLAAGHLGPGSRFRLGSRYRGQAALGMALARIGAISAELGLNLIGPGRAPADQPVQEPPA